MKLIKQNNNEIQLGQVPSLLTPVQATMSIWGLIEIGHEHNNLRTV